MAIVSLSEAKEHLRVDQSYEDTIIQLYIDAADEYISNYLNDAGYPKTNAIKAAALLIIGGLYENREQYGDAEFKEIPAVYGLLFPYRKRMGV